MELLIPGLILVALMVYASTRIKKTAAQAFEPESIDTDVFEIEKPEGFLSVIGGDPALEFEAYSREFGDEGAENVRQARVEIRILENFSLDAAASAIKGAAKVVSDVREIMDERKYRLIETEISEKGIKILEFYKLAASGPNVCQLKVSALEETNVEIARKIETIIASFTVK